MRKSKNREKIIQLFQKEHLLSAHECHKRLKTMDLATVYRNLKQLTESKYLKEVHINNDEIHYELNKSNHQHLICNKCGDIDSISISNSQLSSLLKDKNFISERIEMNVHGRCKNCK